MNVVIFHDLDLPSLEVVSFGKESFTRCRCAKFESWDYYLSFILDLPSLQKLIFIGGCVDYRNILSGDNENNPKTTVNGFDSYDNTLIMKSIKIPREYDC